MSITKPPPLIEVPDFPKFATIVVQKSTLIDLKSTRTRASLVLSPGRWHVCGRKTLNGEWCVAADRVPSYPNDPAPLKVFL